MVFLLASAAIPPQQVEGFPNGCKRSCKGALHVRPGTVAVTEDEWKYIQDKRPDLLRYLTVNERKRRTRSFSASVAEKPTTLPESDLPKPVRRGRKGESFPDSE